MRLVWAALSRKLRGTAAAASGRRLFYLARSALRTQSESCNKEKKKRRGELLLSIVKGGVAWQKEGASFNRRGRQAWREEKLVPAGCLV